MEKFLPPNPLLQNFLEREFYINHFKKNENQKKYIEKR